MVWCVKIVLLLNTCTAYESCLVTIKILYFQGNANLESWVDEQSTVHRISFLRVYRNSLGKLTVQSNKLIKCNLLFVHRLFWIFFFLYKVPSKGPKCCYAGRFWPLESTQGVTKSHSERHIPISCYICTGTHISNLRLL